MEDENRNPEIPIEPIMGPMNSERDFQRLKILTYVNSLALFILALSYFSFRDNSRDAINQQQIQMQEMSSSINAVENRADEANDKANDIEYEMEDIKSNLNW